MEKNKAVGPDGFANDFYQECCHIIKHDMMNMFVDFHKHEIDLGRIS
jgi:hypothetical protein